MFRVAARLDEAWVLNYMHCIARFRVPSLAQVAFGLLSTMAQGPRPHPELQTLEPEASVLPLVSREWTNGVQL